CVFSAAFGGYGSRNRKNFAPLAGVLVRKFCELTISTASVTPLQPPGGKRSAASGTKPAAPNGQLSTAFDPARAICKRGGGTSASSTPSPSRSIPMRVPDPGGTPVIVSVSPACTFATSCARVNVARFVESAL